MNIPLPFIPNRANNNWQTNFASITKSNESSPQANKKQRDVGESARDSLAYSCLLKNELLGTAIDDVKTVTDDRNENSFMPSAKRGLFKYQSPSKQVSTNVQLFVIWSIAFCCGESFCCEGRNSESSSRKNYSLSWTIKKL